MKRLLLAALLALPLPALAQDTLSAPGARVCFVNLTDGQTVQSPVTVAFGLSGMGVAPAETIRENTGHRHLLLDRPPFAQGEFGAEEFTLAVPKDAHNRHFGGGQTQTTLDLPPGPRTLHLVLGDHGHVPHVPPVMSEVITINVE